MIPDTYDPVIADALRARPHGGLGVPHIRAQMWQESRMDPRAISPAGALGLMQIMPKTARDTLLPEVGIPYSEWRPFYPPQSALLGVCYLLMMMEHFVDRCPAWWERWGFALACYNAGYARVNRAMIQARGMAWDEWVAAGGPRGRWQEFDAVAPLIVQHVGSDEPVVYVRNVRRYHADQPT